LVRSLRAAGRGADALGEGVELPLGVVLLPAVALLKGADQLVAVALGAVEIVVGELAPGALHVALELLPAAFEDVVVHDVYLLGG
jgi:hypothetical protein